MVTPSSVEIERRSPTGEVNGVVVCEPVMPLAARSTVLLCDVAGGAEKHSSPPSVRRFLKCCPGTLLRHSVAITADGDLLKSQSVRGAILRPPPCRRLSEITRLATEVSFWLLDGQSYSLATSAVVEWQLVANAVATRWRFLTLAKNRLSRK